MAPGTRSSTIDHKARNGAIDPAEKYAKRPRHRTNADKYEYKGNATLTAKEPDGNRRKRVRRGNTVNEEFQATNIDVARVSLKPQNNLGLFSRSKRSIPLAGRDLPDLTFTKMDFLHNPSKTAKQDMTQRRRRKSDEGHKSFLVDRHITPQLNPAKPSVWSEDLSPTISFEHEYLEDGQESYNLQNLGISSARNRVTESVL